MSEKIEAINDIFKDVLENEDLVITPETSASDVEEWDSLNHIYLIVEIEKYFKVKFTTQQISEWNCVGDMLLAIDKLLA